MFLICAECICLKDPENPCLQNGQRSGNRAQLHSLSRRVRSKGESQSRELTTRLKDETRASLFEQDFLLGQILYNPSHRWKSDTPADSPPDPPHSLSHCAGWARVTETILRYVLTLELKTSESLCSQNVRARRISGSSCFLF